MRCPRRRAGNRWTNSPSAGGTSPARKGGTPTRWWPRDAAGTCRSGIQCSSASHVDPPHPHTSGPGTEGRLARTHHQLAHQHGARPRAQSKSGPADRGGNGAAPETTAPATSCHACTQCNSPHPQALPRRKCPAGRTRTPARSWRPHPTGILYRGDTQCRLPRSSARPRRSTCQRGIGRTA